MMFNNCLDAAHLIATAINTESKTAGYMAYEAEHPPGSYGSYEWRESGLRLLFPAHILTDMLPRLAANKVKYNTIAQPFGRFKDRESVIDHLSMIEGGSEAFKRYLQEETVAVRDGTDGYWRERYHHSTAPKAPQHPSTSIGPPIDWAKESSTGIGRVWQYYALLRLWPSILISEPDWFVRVRQVETSEDPQVTPVALIDHLNKLRWSLQEDWVNIEPVASEQVQSAVGQQSLAGFLNAYRSSFSTDSLESPHPTADDGRNAVEEVRVARMNNSGAGRAASKYGYKSFSNGLRVGRPDDFLIVPEAHIGEGSTSTSLGHDGGHTDCRHIATKDEYNTGPEVRGDSSNISRAGRIAFESPDDTFARESNWNQRQSPHHDSDAASNHGSEAASDHHGELQPGSREYELSYSESAKEEITASEQVSSEDEAEYPDPWRFEKPF